MLGMLKKPDGSFTRTAAETLELMAHVHFPGSTVLANGEARPAQTPSRRRPDVQDWRMASVVFIPDRVKWAIDSFSPYKTGGEDGLFPALLQQGRDIILPLWC